MSKLRFRWLWIVVGLEALGIAALLVWGLVLRDSNAPSTTEQSSEQTQTEPTHNPPKVELVQIAGGFSQPVAIASMPNADDKRLFVVEQGGTVRVINADKTVAETPFLDIKSKVQNDGEMGLLGLAFHPKVAENNFFYVNYVDKSRNTVIARYTITEDGTANASSEKVLLRVRQPFANHNGGHLAFGPDGYLYIGMGDGGSAGDPGNRAQNKDELFGKMLRIDVDSGDPYGIPADNPFASSGGKPEIWSTGLRNPWRFSFDREKGDLFIADVGQGDWEEVNFQAKSSKGGENYGWRCFEGTHSFKNAECPEQTLATPITEYDHNEGRCSVTGGYVYRGSAYPALDGRYFYGDYCNGQVFTAQFLDARWQSGLAATTSLQISTFGENSAGELFVADYANGTVHQITDIAN